MNIAKVIQESGWSLDDLAGHSGIDESRITALAFGADPSMIELRGIASALGSSISDLLLQDDSATQTSVLFRQTIQSRPGNRKIAAPIGDFSRKVSQSLEILEEPDALEWIKQLRPSRQDYASAEEAASGFRELFFEDNHIAPLGDLPSIAVDEAGILLYLVNNSDFEGASTVIDGHAFIFISRRTFAPRMLFTLAHELGHIIAHHGEESFAVLDVPGDIQVMRPRRRAEEGFADAFASCLLLPRHGLGIALKTIRKTLHSTNEQIGDVELLYLSRIFGVSFQVAAKRCEDLGLLPNAGAASLYDNVRKLHGNPEKYATKIGLPERGDIDFPVLPPHLVRDAISGIREGRVSAGRVASILKLNIADIFRINAGAWQPR
jgi:Zn-dependent peptidase ImmA (M78 family)